MTDTIIDLPEEALNKRQIEVLSALRVPLFHQHGTEQSFIAKGYWNSIKPALQEALIRVLNNGGAHE